MIAMRASTLAVCGISFLLTVPLLAGASVRLIPADAAGAQVRLLVLAGRGGDTFDPTKKIAVSNNTGTTADTLGLSAAANDQQLALKNGADATAAPTSGVLRGSREGS